MFEGDLPAQLKLIDAMGRHSNVATMDELRSLIKALAASAKTGPERAVLYRALAQALEGKSADHPLVKAARQIVRDAKRGIHIGAITAFPSLLEELKKAQTLALADTTELKQIDLYDLRRLGQKMVDAARQGRLDDRQEAVAEDFRWPCRLSELAAKVHLPAALPRNRGGASARRAAAASEAWTGGFLADLAVRLRGRQDLRAGKYSKSDVQNARRRREPKGGLGWQADGTRRSFTDQEKNFLEKALADLDKVIAEYPTQARKMFNVAPLMFALVLPTWVMGLVGVAALGALAFYLIRRYRSSKSVATEPAVPRTNEGMVSADVARRAPRLRPVKFATSARAGNSPGSSAGAGFRRGQALRRRRRARRGLEDVGAHGRILRQEVRAKKRCRWCCLSTSRTRDGPRGADKRRDRRCAPC